MTFANLKNNRQEQLDALNKELNKLTAKDQKDEDSRFWYPQVDKAGNGNAIIRFLPPVEGESIPFVRFFTHGFQGPTGLWYIEMCPTTKGHKCPVCDHNRELWNTGSESKRKIVSKQKRRVSIISNILVQKDPMNPENEGKVFLYKYGVKIFDKWNELMNPAFDGDEPVNVFDFWQGANLRLKIRNVDGYRNYDKSEFEQPSALSKDDKVLEKLWKQEYPLLPFIDDSLFKTEAELKVQLNRVLGLDKPVTEDSFGDYDEEEEGEDVVAPFESKPSSDNEDDLDEDFFKKLADV